MRRAWLAAAGWLAVVGCGAAAAGGATPASPKPEDGSRPSGDERVGGAVLYRPVRGAAYTLTRHDSLDLQLPGGGSQVQLLDRTAYLRVGVAEGQGAYQATITLDSLRGTSGGVPLPADSLAKADGTRWTATLTPSGRLSGLRADRASALGDQISGSLRLLFPALPAGGARSGSQWSDSTQFPLRADAFDATERLVIVYRASEGQAPGGRQALKLESSGTYRRTGTGVQADQALEMTASGVRRGVHYLGTDGTLVAAEGSDSGEMMITVPAVGQTVPVKQVGRYSITVR
jgi:hypothetical protein